MKRFASVLLLTLLALFAAPPAINLATAQDAQVRRAAASLPIPVSVDNFTGTFNLSRFTTVNGVVTAVGTLTGTLTTPAGPVGIVRTLSLPLLGAPTGTCDVLHLELGPLDLNLLGVVVHLDRIVLDIDAQPGPGNLLGNLLCSVAQLLDRPAALVRVLNQILQAIS
jgi:hypothetical protein